MTSATRVPADVADGSPAAVYRAGLAEGRLLFQSCDACGRAVFHPRVVCPHCGSAALTWSQSQGRGTVYATTVVRSRAGAYNVSLIDLDEGFRMMCRVEGQEDETVRIGERVGAVIPPGATPEDIGFVVRGAE